MSNIVTIKEYLERIKDKKKCTPQAVRKAIKDKAYNRLPGVISANKLGRDHLLTITL